MPSSNGVYSLPPGYLAQTGTTIQVSQHNPIFEDVAAALTARLSRDGTAPMTGPINLAAGSVTSSSLIFQGNVGNGLYPTMNGIGVGIGGAQVAEFVAGGINGAFLPGMMITWTGSTAPSALWVLPHGQTLSRLGQPQLWIFAQGEIAAGNLLYNNGDGSTTFGIPDMRGRVPAGWDKMGGVAAGRLTSQVAGSTLGSVGGVEVVALTAAQIPTIVSLNNASPSYNLSSGSTSGGITDIGVTGTTTGGGGFGFNAVSSEGNVGVTGFTTITANSLSTVSSNTGGGAHSNVQPTLVCNYILFVGD